MRCSGWLVLLSLVAALLQAQAPDAQIRALIEAAQQAEQREDLDKAAEAYRKILQLKPNWASAEFNLALIYHSQRKYTDAITLLQKALGHNPALSDVHLFLGSSYLHLYQFDKAQASLEQFLKLQPDSDEARQLLAETHFRMGAYDKAAGEYLRQIGHSPVKPEAYYYARESLLALAGACLRDLNGSPDSYYRELAAAEEAANSESAETSIQALIARDPQRSDAYIALGTLKRRQGKASDAKAAFDKALQLAPREAEILAGGVPSLCAGKQDRLIRAACLVNQSKLVESVDALLAIRADQRQTSRETYWAMRLFSRLAEITMQQLAAQAPQSPVLAIIRAKVFEQAGDTAQAENAYAKAAQNGDNESLIEYGKFKCRNSEFGPAIALFERALAQDAERPDVHGLLSEVYMIQGDASKALRHASRAVQGNPASTQCRLYLAQALQKLNRAGEAIKVLEAAASDPDGRVHYLLARYLTQQGRKEEASAALEVFKERRKSGASAATSLTGATVPDQ